MYQALRRSLAVVAIAAGLAALLAAITLVLLTLLTALLILLAVHGAGALLLLILPICTAGLTLTGLIALRTLTTLSRLALLTLLVLALTFHLAFALLILLAIGILVHFVAVAAALTILVHGIFSCEYPGRGRSQNGSQRALVPIITAKCLKKRYSDNETSANCSAALRMRAAVRNRLAVTRKGYTWLSR
ncbi:hypothetical protein ASE00_02210 [Sphingomonas sp. Root710]|nr:hypothetical protein ASE00_02210 [Sphingomonas sp. Root710]